MGGRVTGVACEAQVSTEVAGDMSAIELTASSCMTGDGEIVLVLVVVVVMVLVVEVIEMVVAVATSEACEEPVGDSVPKDRSPAIVAAFLRSAPDLGVMARF